MIRTLGKVTLFGALLLAGCSPDGSGEGAIEDVEAEWSLSAEATLAIGEAEGDPNYLFGQITAGRLFPDGRIVVADQQAGTLRCYGPDGAFLWESGGNGDGPGEYRYFQSVTFTAPDTIAIYDSDLYRLTRVAGDGSLLSTLAFAGEGASPEMYLGKFATGDYAMAGIKSASRGMVAPRADSMLLARYGPDGRFKAVVGLAGGLRRFGRGPVHFSPYLHAFAVGDSLFVTDGVRAEVEVLDAEGTRVRRFGIPEVPLPMETARADLETELRARENTMALEILASTPDDVVPQLAEVLLDDAGRFWLKRYDPRTDSLWLGAQMAGGVWVVVDPVDGVVATTRLPDGLVPLDVRATTVLGLTRDDLGVERVVTYQIER